MTEVLLVTALALVLAFWVLRPVFAGRGPRPDTGGDPALEDLVERKGSVYRTILDLEMDFKMGKLDRVQYERLRNESKAEALELIRRIEGSRQAGEPEELTLEQEIEQARARLRNQ